MTAVIMDFCIHKKITHLNRSQNSQHASIAVTWLYQHQDTVCLLDCSACLLVNFFRFRASTGNR